MELANLLKREFKNIYHKGFEVFNILIFFIIISFALAFGAKGDLGLPVAASVVIVCFMLASNLSAHFIFEREMESGMLQQLFINLKSLNSLIIAKMIAQFVCFGLPLVITLPLISLFYNIDEIPLLMAMIAFSAMIISVVNVMMAGITAGLKAGGVISAILSIPLYIPLIVLNVGFLEAKISGEGMSLQQYITNIAAFALIITPLSIFAIRQTIRNAVED